MCGLWTCRRLTCSFTLLLACALPAFNQRSGSTTGAGSSAGSAGNAGSLGGTVASRSPLNTTNGTSNATTGLPGSSRAIFLSGRVMFDDGAPPNTEIRIERVCTGSSPRLEAHTDSKGLFYLQIGSNATVDTDAADSSTGVGRSAGATGQSSASGTGGAGSSALFNCDLRASYPGYRSDVISLASRRTMDEPDVGTIVLHHLGDIKGTTVSMTSVLAPKRAVKDYEKGLQLVRKGKNEEAEKLFAAATDDYPKYAVAWFALGELQQNSNQLPQAQKSYETAIAADPKYVSPYDRLSYLFGQQSKWRESADYSREALDLNPVEFPSCYWYNALANYNLKRFDQAEKSAAGVLKVDSAHRYPEAEVLLANLLAQKGRYSESAAHLRAYLALRPNAQNADSLKQHLAALEKAAGQPK